MKKFKKNQGKSLEKQLAEYKVQAGGLPFDVKKCGSLVLTGSVFLMGMPVAEAAVIQTLVNATVNGGKFDVDINNDAIKEAAIKVSNGSSVLWDGNYGTNVTLVGTGSNYPYLLNPMYAVNAGVNFMTANAGTLTTGSGTGGNWLGNPAKGFLGLRFDIGGNTHYGWVELWVTSANNGDNKVEIKRWAYENVAGASITTPALTVLPVELTHFSARPTPEAVRLNWKTESETNNAGFHVERSEDGKNFQKIKWAEGHGTTLEPQEYLFDDKNLRSGKTYYYRLRQVDYDGGFEYSDIVSVSLKGGDVQVGEFYPNPAPSGMVSIDFKIKEEAEWTVSIFEMSGKEVQRFEKYIAGENGQVQLDISGFTGGLYFVKFEQGGERFYRKLKVDNF